MECSTVVSPRLSHSRRLFSIYQEYVYTIIQYNKDELSRLNLKAFYEKKIFKKNKTNEFA
jgi:hypothetical protein